MSNEKILIVEDEPAVARGLQYGLEIEGFKVLWAKTGRAALEITVDQNPDLVLLDIRLPDINGFDVCRQLRADGIRIPILMLTARDEPVDKVVGLELGADDYVVKPYDLRELIARIRALLRRAYGELSSTSPGERIVVGDLVLDLDELSVTNQGKDISLTPIEFRILRYLALHPNRPVNRSAIVDAVWGYSPGIGSDRMVDVHIRHLRQKLEINPANPQLIQTVRGIGYRFGVQ
jgi:DNA-binding response OmpR family regulator